MTRTKTMLPIITVTNTTTIKAKQVGPTPKSNSILKCIFGPKRFWAQKIVVSKKMLVPKKILVQQNFGSKVQKMFGSESNVESKKNRVYKNVGSKKVWAKKFLGPKFFWLDLSDFTN